MRGYGGLCYFVVGEGRWREGTRHCGVFGGVSLRLMRMEEFGVGERGR